MFFFAPRSHAYVSATCIRFFCMPLLFFLVSCCMLFIHLFLPTSGVMSTVRVVSSEISGRKFPEIYSNFSGKLLNIFSLYTF